MPGNELMGIAIIVAEQIFLQVMKSFLDQTYAKLLNLMLRRFFQFSLVL